jgi:hypothetical protein
MASKLSQLTNKTTLAATDQLYAIDPSSKRLTISNLQKNLGPNQLLTPPVDAQFSWVNQGGASVVTGDFGICLRVPASAARSLRIRDKAAPTTPYTITAGFFYTILDEVTTGDCDFGLGFRNNAGGQIAFLDYGGFSNSYDNLIVRKLTSPTVFSADYLAKNFRQNSSLLWMRIRDDGVNRISSVSPDGVNFIQFHSVARTDFVTPDRVFWGMSNVSTANQVDGLFTLVSWLEGT